MSARFDLPWTPIQLVDSRVILGERLGLRIAPYIFPDLLLPSQREVWLDDSSYDGCSAILQRM
jgi:hypothetical protein